MTRRGLFGLLTGLFVNRRFAKAAVPKPSPFLDEINAFTLNYINPRIADLMYSRPSALSRFFRTHTVDSSSEQIKLPWNGFD